MKLSSNIFREAVKKLDFYGIVRIPVNKSDVLIIQYSIKFDAFVCCVAGVETGFAVANKQNIIQGAKTCTIALATFRTMYMKQPLIL